MPLPNAQHIAPQEGGHEPQRTFQWEFIVVLDVNQGDGSIITLSAQSFVPPVIGSEEIAIPYGNETVYVAGKATYETSDLIVVDYVSERIAQLMYEWAQQKYDPESGEMRPATAYKKQATLRDRTLVDGAKGSEWELQGCWPTTVNYGERDYGNSDAVKITATLRYDRAIKRQ